MPNFCTNITPICTPKKSSQSLQFRLRKNLLNHYNFDSEKYFFRDSDSNSNSENILFCDSDSGGVGVEIGFSDSVQFTTYSV